MEKTQEWVKENIIPLFFNSNKNLILLVVLIFLGFPLYYLKHLFCRRG